MGFRILICILIFSALQHGHVRAAEISIRFDEIGEYASANSPHAFILERDMDLVRVERDLSLRWSNPLLSWEFERVEGDAEAEREYNLTLEKELTMPWVAAGHRAGWNLRLEAARHRKTADTRRLFSMLRRGYAMLNIHETQAGFLGRFESLMERASKITDARKHEGAISGVEQRLIGMSVLGIRRRIQENRDEYRAHLAEWKTDMGIPAETDVRLETDIVFMRGSLDTHPLNVMGTDAIADLAGRELETEALSKAIQVEKGGILPSVTLTGGYKNVNDELEGFVIGVSVPLPFLNRNAGGVDRVRAEYARARVELDLYRSARVRRIAVLIESVEERMELLERYGKTMEKVDEQIEDLVVSYQEGWMTLIELLEGIEIYAEGIENYFGILGEYFDAIFELEALTERELLGSVLQERGETGR